MAHMSRMSKRTACSPLKRTSLFKFWLLMMPKYTASKTSVSKHQMPTTTTFAPH